jgi:hypothetical protein
MNGENAAIRLMTVRLEVIIGWILSDDGDPFRRGYAKGSLDHLEMCLRDEIITLCVNENLA